MRRRVNAPSAQRMNATPKGVRKPREYLMKRNEHPHTIPVATYAGTHERDVGAVTFEG
jgi:hypothetical protein